MIISIDQSPLWRPQLAGREELSQLLDALFRAGLGRRPASRLEVLYLSHALDCSEEEIEAYAGVPAATGRTPRGAARLLRMQPRVRHSYSPTKPA
jgi:hypothetical protein